MHFLNGLQPQYDLTYDDVFMVPSRSSVTSRLDVDLATVDGTGTTIPIVVANMTAIAGRRMAETVARRGGLTVVPQDIPVDVVSEVIGWVKERHLVHDTAITLDPHMTAGEAHVLLGKRAHGAGIVVEGRRPVGIVTEKDLTGVDRFTRSRTSCSVRWSSCPRTSTRGMRSSGSARSGAGSRLSWRWTARSSASSPRRRPCGPASTRCGRRSRPLQVAAAVGINGDVAAKAARILDAGADVLVIDTAHGHQDKMIDALQKVRAIDPQVPVVAGNVVSATGTRELIEAGADIVKVGVGPGDVHDADEDGGLAPVLRSSRMRQAVSGELGKHVWADGGVRHRAMWRWRSRPVRRTS